MQPSKGGFSTGSSAEKGIKTMCGNNSCLWIIIILIILFSCGGCGSIGCGGCGCDNGCGCNNNNCGCC